MQKCPMCVICKHFRTVRFNKPFTCDAYPGGIPAVILDGKYDHRKPYRGDNGITWEPADEQAKELIKKVNIP